MMRNIINYLLFFCPSFIHVRVRRFLGQKIGKGVKLKIGTLIISNLIEIGSNTSLGPLTFIISKQLKIGEFSKIKSLVILKTLKINILNYVHIAPMSIINSEFLENSSIEIGDHSRIFPFCWLDTGEGIKIGSNVGIGGHTLLFTHGVWSNFVDGGPIDFGPIVIKDNVWLPWRVFILPNVTIGKNAIIGANSLVNKNVADDMLVAGSPIKEIKKLQFDGHLKNKRFNKILREYSNYINFKLNVQSSFEENNLFFNKVKIIIDDFNKVSKGDLLICLENKCKNINDLKKMEISVLDYEKMTIYINANKSKEILLFIGFLRRFGVRLYIQ